VRILKSDIAKEQEYEPLNLARGLGRIHIIEKLDDHVEIGSNEILVLNEVPRINGMPKDAPPLQRMLYTLVPSFDQAQACYNAAQNGEVARDLQLIEQSRINSAPSKLGSGKETSLPTETKAQNHGARSQPDFTEYLLAVEPPPQRRHRRGTMAGVGIGALLTVVVVAGTILYTRQSGSLAAFGVHIEDIVGVRWKKPAQVPENITQDTVGQLHVRHLQRTNSRASEFLMGNPGDDGATAFTKKFPSAPPATDKPNLSNEMPGYPNSEEANKQASDAKTKAKERGSTGTYKVFSPSYVRDKPRSDATITGMLEPGTRLKVQSKTGDYFRVRSLDKEPISGYVHREDAFFEPAK
jgi:hypothetical protein